MLTRIIYSVLLGVLAMLFANFVTALVYKAPDDPTYSEAYDTATDGYSKVWENYNTQLTQYSRNVTSVNIGAAVVLALLGLLLLGRSLIVADGLMIGSTLILYFGHLRGYANAGSESNTWQLTVAALGLIIILFFGFTREGRIREGEL